MNITIVGGGNIGTQFAVHCAKKNHKVTIYTSKYKLFSNDLEIVDGRGVKLHSANISSATDDAEKAFKYADLIFVTTPSFLAEKVYSEIAPYFHKGMLIGLIPGTGGMECVFKDCIKNGCVLFGLQRVPSVARLIEYGKKVCAEGYREKLHLAALPKGDTEKCCKIVSEIFDMPCEALPCYLNVTLTPSNPILHTSRLYGLFSDYSVGKAYKYIPLFYEEWDDKASELLLKCDEEVQNICKALDGFDLSFVKSLKLHYESETVQQMTAKIRSIKGFKGIKTPMVESRSGYIPDFSSRYFISDFSFGLKILKQIAGFAEVKTPTMDMLLNWYESVAVDKNHFEFEKYSIQDIESFNKFYCL